MADYRSARSRHTILDDLAAGADHGQRFVTVADADPLTAGAALIFDADGNAASGISPGSVAVAKNDTLVGTRGRINLIEGSNITITATDDSGSNEVDVTIAASAGGGGTGKAGDWIDPPTSGWSWVDTSHTVDTSQSFINIENASANIGSYVRAAASAPWTIHLGHRIFIIGSNWANGITLRNSSSDKRHYFFFYNGNLYIQRYTGATFNSTVFGPATLGTFTTGDGGLSLFLFVQDDNTNLIFSVGMSRHHPIQVRSEARGDWAIPDEYGIMFGDAAGNPTRAMDVVSWEEV